METPPSTSHVVFAFDATKGYNERELSLIIHNIIFRGDILSGGDTLLMLGVLHRITHPMGYQSRPMPDVITSVRVIEEDITKKLDAYVNMLQQSAEECDEKGVSIEVKITAGIPIKNVILQEVETSNAAWVVIDRHIKRDLKLQNIKQIPCKIALVQDGHHVEVLRNRTISKTEAIELKQFYSMSKPVPLSNFQGISENIDQTEKSFRSYSLSMTSTDNSKSSHVRPSIYTLKSHDHSFSSDFGPSSCYVR